MFTLLPSKNKYKFYLKYLEIFIFSFLGYNIFGIFFFFFSFLEF